MTRKTSDTLRLVPADPTAKTKGQRLVDLRKAVLGSQEALLDAIGEVARRLGYEPLDRIELSKIENDRSKFTRYDTRAQIAGALGLSTDDLSLYLDGKLTLPDALRRRGSTSRPVFTNADRDDWAALVAGAREEDPTLDEGILRELGESPTYKDTPLDARELADIAAAIMRHRARRKRGQGAP